MYGRYVPGSSRRYLSLSLKVGGGVTLMLLTVIF